MDKATFEEVYERTCGIMYRRGFNAFQKHGAETLAAIIRKVLVLEEQGKHSAFEETAQWAWDENGMDWNLGAWRCSRCHARNANLPGRKDINPYQFSGSKFCPNCGKPMMPPTH